ncbi:MAG TPA: DUF4215 domain-containing protein, partial [Nannocystis sp.]
MRSSSFLALILLPACLQSSTDLSDPKGTGTDPAGASSGGNEPIGTTSDGAGTTTPDPCDDDPACGPDEANTCPAQCSICGDGLVSGDEACDHGPDNQTYWLTTPPPDACSDTCTTQVQWCGDATVDASELCDNGTNLDPAYSIAPPPATACAPGCVLPGHCGDAILNGPELCDDAAQTPTCELSCLPPTCGDGAHNPLAGEACDDANTLDGDGCSADC